MKHLKPGFIFLLIFLSCSKDDEHIQSPYEYPTIWKEVAPPRRGGDWYNLYFLKDSTFNLEIDNINDFIIPGEPCSQLSWKEYVKGKFKLKTDSLILEGIYSDSLYRPISTGCYNLGPFNASFSYSLSADTLLLSSKGVSWPRKLIRAEN